MSLYATALRLDRQDYCEFAITDLYSLHRVVYDLFDDQRDALQKKLSIPSGIQWVEGHSSSLFKEILILSNRPISATAAAQHSVISSRIIPASFFTHSLYRFEVVVNPCRRERHSRKLIPLKQPDQVAQWFQERAESCWGFKIVSPPVQVGAIQLAQFFTQQTITLHRVQVSGYLTVLDETRFQATMARGIGRGRAFGCGLLQITPIVEHAFY